MRHSVPAFPSKWCGKMELLFIPMKEYQHQAPQENPSPSSFQKPDDGWTENLLLSGQTAEQQQAAAGV